VVVLDGLSAYAFTRFGVVAKWAALSGAAKTAARALRGLARLPGGEPRWLRELLEKALTTGHWDRVHPHPLSMPDIVCYLPPNALGLTSDWDRLVQDWRRSAGRSAAVDLKGWLTTKYRVNLGVRALRRAVKTAVPVREIQDLGLEIRVLSGMRGVDPEM
jgi:hypothetical protein